MSESEMTSHSPDQHFGAREPTRTNTISPPPQSIVNSLNNIPGNSNWVPHGQIGNQIPAGLMHRNNVALRPPANMNQMNRSNPAPMNNRGHQMQQCNMNGMRGNMMYNAGVYNASMNMNRPINHAVGFNKPLSSGIVQRNRPGASSTMSTMDSLPAKSSLITRQHQWNHQNYSNPNNPNYQQVSPQLLQHYMTTKFSSRPTSKMQEVHRQHQLQQRRLYRNVEKTPPSVNMKSFLVPPSTFKNGRPHLGELLSFCETIYRGQILTENPVKPANVLRSFRPTGEIDVAHIPEVVDSINIIVRIFGVREIVWQPCRIYTIRNKNESPIMQQYTKYGNNSSYISGPLQYHPITMRPTSPGDTRGEGDIRHLYVQPNDSRWRLPRWHFMGHSTIAAATPVVVSILGFLDDISILRLRLCGQENRRWIDFWLGTLMSLSCFETATKLSKRCRKSSANWSLLRSADCLQPVPWVSASDMDIIEQVFTRAKPNGSPTLDVPPTLSKSLNATVEPGGIFSISRGKTPAPSDYNSDKFSDGVKRSISQFGAVRDELYASDIYPSIYIEEGDIIGPYVPGSFYADYTCKLYNLWRQNIGRRISLHTRSAYSLWYNHELLHRKRIRQHKPQTIAVEPHYNSKVLCFLEENPKGIRKQQMLAIQTVVDKMKSNFGSKDTNTNPPNKTNMNRPDCCDEIERPNSHIGDWNSNINEVTIKESSRTHPREKRTHRKRLDRQAQLEVKNVTYRRAVEALHRHWDEDLAVPFKRPTPDGMASSYVRKEKDVLFCSLCVLQTRMEWDLVCAIHALVSVLYQIQQNPHDNALNEVRVTLEAVVRRMKVDRLMNILLQWRMIRLKTRLRESLRVNLCDEKTFRFKELFWPRASPESGCRSPSTAPCPGSFHQKVYTSKLVTKLDLLNHIANVKDEGSRKRKRVSL